MTNKTSAWRPVVPVANMAGSAGKTTTAVTLAALLAESGREVLLVDVDAQSNATSWLGIDPDDVEISSGDVLLKRARLEEAIVETSTPRLRLVPATPGLDGDAIALLSETGREMRLKLALRACPDDVDVVIIDCPGSMSVLTVSALVVATSVVTVTAPSSKELEGIPKLEALIEEVAEAYNPDLELGAIVPCIVPPATAGRLYTDALAALQEAYGDLVTPTVRKTVRAPEAMSHHETLPAYAPRDPVTEDYRAVLAALEKGGVL